MLTVSQAKDLILSEFSLLPSEVVPIQESLHRRLTEPILADHDLPLFDNSSMDGLAVIAADLHSASKDKPARLKIIETIPAGHHPEKQIQPGQTSLIMTGAPIPPGADAVIPVERTNLDFSRPVEDDHALVFSSVDQGAYIRRQGEYYRSGQVLFQPTNAVRPQDIALLSTVGFCDVAVTRKPKVGILTTGDELISPDSPLKPGKIRDSNSYMLRALIEGFHAETVSSGIIADTAEDVAAAMHTLAGSGVDLIITSGGVSMGAYDVVRSVVEAHGELKLWKVNMRPGKPVAFGHFQEIPFIGLAGNPVSAFVGFQIFVKPALQIMTGFPISNEEVSAELIADTPSDGRESYIPAWLDIESGQYTVEPTRNQSSGNLFALIRANSLIIVPLGVEFLSKGHQVKVLRL